MCAGKCGIKVHLSGGHIRYIEGNSDHPVNKGALCAKGSAGIMQQYSPARLTKPLRRTGERGSGDFEEIDIHSYFSRPWENFFRHVLSWGLQVSPIDHI